MQTKGGSLRRIKNQVFCRFVFCLFFVSQSFPLENRVLNLEGGFA